MKGDIHKCGARSDIYKRGGNIYKYGATFINEGGNIYKYGTTFINGGTTFINGGRHL